VHNAAVLPLLMMRKGYATGLGSPTTSLIMPKSYRKRS
jgi:hypothetical protein